jgi:phosphoribosylformimino-5-aminoimidazole carboxamide ribotide isomerase
MGQVMTQQLMDDSPSRSTFEIYPAIDLRQGRVVRLAQGDPERETSYAHDPLRVARRWEALGARWVHVVNLDGAFGETNQGNQQALAGILETSLKVQFGGGMRDMTALSRALGGLPERASDQGQQNPGGSADLPLHRSVSRVVVGTAFVEDPALVQSALDSYGPERVAVGIDARDGVVQIRGWQEAAPFQALALAERWAELGGRWLIFTDISRDGMGSGVNVKVTADLARETGLRVIASGGVGTLDDVRRVRDAGLSGVIIGRALYEGQIKLEDALCLPESLL